MILKKDNLKLGLILGLIGPLLGLVVIYFVKYSALSFGDFLISFMNEKRLITSIGSLVFAGQCGSVYTICKYAPGSYSQRNFYCYSYLWYWHLGIKDPSLISKSLLFGYWIVSQFELHRGPQSIYREPRKIFSSVLPRF